MMMLCADLTAGANASNSGAASFTDDVSLGHVNWSQVLAGGGRSSEVVLSATVKVSAKTALCGTESGSDGDGRVVAGISDEKTQRSGQKENVVLVVLVDLEDLGVSLWEDKFFREGLRFSIDDDVVHVIEFDLVFSSHDLKTKFVVGNFLSKNGEPWLLSAVSRDKSVTFGHISKVGSVVEGLDGMWGNITVSVNSQVESLVHQCRKSRVNWSFQGSWEHVKVNTVEMLLFPTRSVPVDISLWVFFIHGHVHLNFTLKKSVSRNTMISVGSVSIDGVAWDPVWHKDGSDKGSRISPAFACFRIDLVVDGDV